MSPKGKEYCQNEFESSSYFRCITLGNMILYRTKKDKHTGGQKNDQVF